MIKFTNADAFCKGLNDWFEEQLSFIERVYRGYTVKIFGYIVMETAQYEGTTVMNWRYSVGEQAAEAANLNAKVYQSVPGKESPLAKGSPQAVDYAVGQSSGVEEQVVFDRHAITLPDVYITNLIDDDYVRRIEYAPAGFLRQVNEPGHMIEFATAIYGQGNLTGAYANKLAVTRMSVSDFDVMGNVMDDSNPLIKSYMNSHGRPH